MMYLTIAAIIAIVGIVGLFYCLRPVECPKCEGWGVWFPPPGLPCEVEDPCRMCNGRGRLT